MSVEILLFAGTVDGDLPLYASHATYYGGQPAKILTTGVDLATTYASIIGMLKNDSTVDAVAGPQVNDAAAGTLSCSVVFGANKVRLTQASAGQVFAYPPTAHSGAWQEGDEIYVAATGGVWDNAAGNAGDPPCGRVVKAPLSATDDMHVYQYPRPVKT